MNYFKKSFDYMSHLFSFLFHLIKKTHFFAKKSYLNKCGMNFFNPLRQVSHS
jgi:hypothetical protein